MMIHYHGTPITPISALMKLGGRHFCVSFARPDDVTRVHEIGQSVMLDNGAFSIWQRALRERRDGDLVDWTTFYEWADRWLDYPTTWAVIPDVIDGGTQLQDALVREWPFGHRGAPVWHMDEPVDRLLRLTDEWPRVCIGSTAEYRVVLSPAWRRRMDETWNAVAVRHRRLPWLHMLRGMQLSGRHYPFASVDSTDVAQNHNRTRAGKAPLLDDGEVRESDPLRMADRWDRMQTPGRWHPAPKQLEFA